MKPTPPPSATSLPASPRDEADGRFKRYAITMAIRTGCFILMVLVTPYGWYTWVLAIGAVFLPYIAVVFANVSDSGRPNKAVAPAREVTATTTPTTAPEATSVITIVETRALDQGEK